MLQVDAYGGYRVLGADRRGAPGLLLEPRRRFYEAASTAQALQRIGELYPVEADARGRPANQGAPSAWIAADL